MVACEGQKVKQSAPSTATKAVTERPSPAGKPVWEAGKTYANEAVGGAGNNRYAFRLPTSYQAEKKYPVLIFFDSHGRGIDPLEKYQSLGDEFGLILIGSNTSKNGQQFPQSQQIYSQLLRDLKQKFSLAEDRIWLAGFSGGARVAATLAQRDAQIAGVLGCAAGFQPQQNDRFNYVGFVGMEDFNYQEMRHLDQTLDQTAMHHGLNYFDGGHEWPPISNLKTGIEFLILRGMADHQVQRDDSLIEALDGAFQKKVQSLKSSSLAEWQHAFEGMWHSSRDGLVEEGRAEHPTSMPSSLIANLDEEERTEVALRNQYGPQIQTKSVDEWRKIAKELHAKANSKNQRTAWMHKRVLNFLSLNVYFQVSGHLGQNNLPAAENFQQIYALVDPENAEHAYLLANIRGRQGKSEAALNALKTAIELGFDDVSRMQTDPDFAGLHGKPEFDDLISKVNAK